MIIGNGLLASAFNSHFRDDPDVIVFASGISNSREDRCEEFMRERKMLVETLAMGKFTCYFSTCSVNDPELLNAPYVIHKKEMESLICSTENYAIFRLPQVVGKTSNPNTLTNYLFKQILAGNHFQVWRNAKRNLIDVEDVASIVSYLVREKHANGIATNIATPLFISIPNLVSVFELVIGRKANYSLVEAGGSYSIDSSLAIDAASQTGIVFDASYIERLIRKYYGK